jgi:bifunctional non-homologous end joining protein LigD
MKRIASEKNREWKSDRVPKRSPKGGLAGRLESRARITPGKRRTSPPDNTSETLAADISKLPSGSPSFIEPMKATVGRKLPEGSQWLYEIKFDGVRCLALKNGSKVELLSRTQNPLAQKYQLIAEEIGQLPVKEAVLDGEIVVLDETGRSSFQLLQVYQQPAGQNLPLLFYAFDIVQLEGRDLKGLPLVTRKAILERLIPPEPSRLRMSAGIDASMGAVVSAMKARGLEGLLAKLKDSNYQPGRRSPAWIKYKWSLEQEFVIGGYTPPKGTRACFGALIVGYNEGESLFCAGKVGTGFDERRLKDLYRQFQSLRRPDCPFANLPARNGSAAGITRSQMRECTWIEPKLVCQIRFTEWTRDGMLRQPSFLGLREDKPPREVIRET